MKILLTSYYASKRFFSGVITFFLVFSFHVSTGINKETNGALFACNKKMTNWIAQIYSEYGTDDLSKAHHDHHKLIVSNLYSDKYYVSIFKRSITEQSEDKFGNLRSQLEECQVLPKMKGWDGRYKREFSYDVVLSAVKTLNDYREQLSRLSESHENGIIELKLLAKWKMSRLKEASSLLMPSDKTFVKRLFNTYKKELEAERNAVFEANKIKIQPFIDEEKAKLMAKFGDMSVVNARNLNYEIDRIQYKDEQSLQVYSAKEILWVNSMIKDFIMEFKTKLIENNVEYVKKDIATQINRSYKNPKSQLTQEYIDYTVKSEVIADLKKRINVDWGEVLIEKKERARIAEIEYEAKMKPIREKSRTDFYAKEKLVKDFADANGFVYRNLGTWYKALTSRLNEDDINIHVSSLWWCKDIFDGNFDSDRSGKMYPPNLGGSLINAFVNKCSMPYWRSKIEGTPEVRVIKSTNRTTHTNFYGSRTYESNNYDTLFMPVALAPLYDYYAGKTETYFFANKILVGVLDHYPPSTPEFKQLMENIIRYCYGKKSLQQMKSERVKNILKEDHKNDPIKPAEGVSSFFDCLDLKGFRVKEEGWGDCK